MYIPKKELNYQLTLVAISLLIVSSNYFYFPMASATDVCYGCMLGLIAATALWGVFYFISINKWVFRVAFPPVFLLAGIQSWNLHFSGTSLIDQLKNPFTGNANSLLDPHAILAISSVFLVLGLLMYFRLSFQFTAAKYGHFAIAVYLMIPAVVTNQISPKSISGQAPFSVVDTIKEICASTNEAQSISFSSTKP